MNSNIPACGKCFFSQCSTPLVNMRFCGQVLHSPINKNSKRLIPYISKKEVFWLPKLGFSLGAYAKKTFPSTLNIMIFQMVRNECVRFSGHVCIKISYKILWLEILKGTPSLHSPPCFEQGLS